MNKEISTSEKIQIFSLSKTILRNRPSLLEKYDLHLLRQCIWDTYQRKDADLYDVFGRNRLISLLQTAQIGVEEMAFHEETIMGCILSFTLEEDTQLPFVIEHFGEDVGRIVHGIYKINDLYSRKPVIESENFRNLLVSFAEDMRVILIMIADRTNLMRSIRDTSNITARKEVSTEASYLYAPLAHKLGLYKVKSELEDLSLKYLEPEAYYLIKEKLNATKTARDKYIDAFIQPIKDRLESAGLTFHIKGRTKSIHSIWQKMKKQHCSFDGVYDLFAIRIILSSPTEKEKQECWQVYSIITDMYQPNPKRLRDWLSIPKSNGYESLHITVLGPESKWVEVQIRTERMDSIAEYGLAAHWRYKGIKSSQGGIEEWLHDIRTALEAGDDLLLMDQLKKELKDEEVYVFTPKGDLYKLSTGATVLDFAYHIHTGVGNHCVGAKINNKNVSMRQILNSGDQVEILTMGNQTPNTDWLNIATTGRAKSKIRQALHEIAVKEAVFTKELLQRKFKNRKLEWEDTKMNAVIKKYGYKELTDFYKAISDKILDINEVMESYISLSQKEKQDERIPARSADTFVLRTKEDPASSGEDGIVIDQNLKNIDFSLAKCCHPIFGDAIFGFVSVNGGIKIHRTNCPNAALLREKFGYRIIPARWSGKASQQYAITLHIIGNDNVGIVNNITSLINKEGDIFLRSISIDSHEGLFEGILTIMVGDTTKLQTLIKKIQNVKGVKAITRE